MRTFEERKSKNARLDLRVSAEQKTLIKEAAELRGVSVSNFLASAAYSEAVKTLQEHQSIILNREESERFAQVLINPPEPNEALRKLMNRQRG